MSQNYTYSHWVVAYLTQRTYADAHKDLVTFYTARLKALSQLFGIPEDWPGQRDIGSERSALADLFEAAVTSYLEASSPFSRYLEAPMEVVRMYRRFGEQLEEARSAYHDVLLALLGEIFLEVHGKTKAALSFSSADLRAVGFDDANAPDPYDYLYCPAET